MKQFSMADVSLYLKIEDETRPTFPLRSWELIWYSVILLTGGLGNVFVCLVICKSGSVFRSTPFNMYLCSLAVADMMLALVVLPNYVLSTQIFNHPGGIWGDFMCKTITGDFLIFYFSVVSEYCLIVICLERLRAVDEFPGIVSNSSTRRRRAWLSIVVAWIIPFTFQSPKAISLLEYKRKHKPTIGNYCIFRWGKEPTIRAKIYGGVILITEGIIPLLIFIYSFYRIRKCLLREEKRLSGRIQGSTFNDGYRYFNCWQFVERKRRTVKILMIAATVFVICWIPNKIMFFMINYLGENHTKFTWNCPEYQVGVLIGFTGSCINPFLYALQSKEFRKHSKKALKSLLPKCLDDDFGYRGFENAAEQNRNQNVGAGTKATKPVKREGVIDSTTTPPPSKTFDSRTYTHTPKINVII